MASALRPTGLIAKTGIELLTFRTPNGHKASIFLEELKEAYGLEYTFQCINLLEGCQKDPWFRDLNPSGQIPVIIDHEHNHFVLSTSQAILMYLARTYDTEYQFSFKDPTDEARCEQWLSFCSGDLTPNQIAAFQFYRIVPERHAFPTQKYIGHAENCYRILDTALDGRDYLVGPGKGKYSIADMANWSMVNFSMFAGIGGLERWTNMKAWWARINERNPTVKGTEIPFKLPITNAGYAKFIEGSPEMQEKENALEEELRKAQERYGYTYSSS